MVSKEKVATKKAPVRKKTAAKKKVATRKTVKKKAARKKVIEPKRRVADWWKTPGRPCEYFDDIAIEICQRIASGETLQVICKEDKMPCLSTVGNWLRRPELKEFKAAYEAAKEQRLDVMADEAMAIADEIPEVEIIDGEPFGGDSPTSVARSKLRVDTRKWMLSKARPDEWGDKTQLEHVGKGGGPIQTKQLAVTGVPSTIKRQVLERDD